MRQDRTTMARRWWTIGFALALACTLAAPATAQGLYVYPVSFECGFQASADGSGGYEPVVKVANYAIKLDYLHLGQNPATLSIGVHETSGASIGQGLPSTASLQGGTLQPGNASLVDCTDIMALVSGSFPVSNGKAFLTGMVTITSSEPLAVWATKTTEVCGGLAQLSLEAWTSTDLLILDENGVGIDTTGLPLPPAAPILFGCPPAAAFNQRYGGGLPSGPFYGPPGSVPPGLRSRQVVPSLGSDTLAEAFGVSHSIDFERVEGIFVEAP